MAIIANILAGLLLAILVWRAIVARTASERDNDEGTPR